MGLHGHIHTIGDMKHLYSFVRLLTISLLLASTLNGEAVAAASAPVPAVPAILAFSQIKVTGDEYLVAQNNSGATIPDLSVYAVKIFNNVNPLASGVAVSTQTLPVVSLEPGDKVTLSAATRQTCGAAVAGKLSASLVDGGGTLQLLMTTNSASTPSLIDSISWSSGASGQIQN